MKLTTNELNQLCHCPLFSGVTPTELNHLLPCLQFSLQRYEAHTTLFTQGVSIDYIYIIIEGKVEISKENFAGQKAIISIFDVNKLFGEGIACTTHRLSSVTATTLEASYLLAIPYTKILQSCSNNCSFHYRIIYNMMRLLADKNYMLNQKIDLLLLKGMRAKLATYLLSEAQNTNSISFTLRLNRNQLADYLNVSRPSMCRELARMKEDGLIDFYQNSFKLLDCNKLQACLLSS